MKANKIAKRLRKRARELHELSGTLMSGDLALTDRARLFADVLQEVADQVSPRTRKKALKKSLKKSSPAASTKKTAPVSTNNGSTHEPRVGIGG